MTITFELPLELEQGLRTDSKSLESEAKEAFLVTLYRQGRISHFAFAQGLGIDRFEAEDILFKHKVSEDLGTAEEYIAEAEELGKLRRSLSQ